MVLSQYEILNWIVSVITQFKSENVLEQLKLVYRRALIDIVEIF